MCRLGGRHAQAFYFGLRRCQHDASRSREKAKSAGRNAVIAIICGWRGLQVLQDPGTCGRRLPRTLARESRHI